jgi:hypothetical protein
MLSFVEAPIVDFMNPFFQEFLKSLPALFVYVAVPVPFIENVVVHPLDF